MWPDWASRQLETSPCTEMSVKFLARRSRILPVNSLTVNVLRSGMRLKVSCCVIEGQCRRLSEIRQGNNARVPAGCGRQRFSGQKVESKATIQYAGQINGGSERQAKAEGRV